jgi:poly(A) polymerase
LSVVEPVIVPRAEHPISRKDIDPDALRVLYRLNQGQHVAYLVGGSVRDLILGRRPKDFDIGTSAHPYQIKKLFRNCWIIGRRFRLAHIKFGMKTIEVATFRQNVPDPPPDQPVEEAVVVATSAPPNAAPADQVDGLIHRDNTFGTPEEDAFRRDFTVNALFYDVSNFTVIDYVGGLEDLERRVIRSIGDPNVRFVEDPVRMLRAAVLAARLDFEMDEFVLDAIERHRALILKAAAPRLMEEYFKILRSGYAEASFGALHGVGLLELITPELEASPDELWASLAKLDRWRRQFPSVPPDLTNPILIGALLVPLGVLNRRRPVTADGEREERVTFGMLPIARKDVDRLRHMMLLLPKLIDPDLPPRLLRGLPGRPAFGDAVTWLEIFGDAPEAVERWKHAQQHHRPSAEADQAAPHHHVAGEPGAPRKRRRRRRRGRRGGGGPAVQA